MVFFTDKVVKAAGILLIRILLGGIFLYQGYQILFDSGIGAIQADVFHSNNSILMPSKPLRFSILFIALIQLSGGIFVMLGLLRSYSLYIMGFIILFVSFSFGNGHTIWQFENTVFQAVLLISLLMLPVEWDKWSFDNLPAYKIQ